MPGNSSSSGAGCTTAPESWCAPTARPLSTSAIGTSPSRLGERRVALQQLRQPDRAGEPGGPAADDRDADLELLVGRRLGRGDDLGRRERRRVRSGRDRHAAIVLRRSRGARRVRTETCQVTLAASATWPLAVASTLSADARRPPLRHRHPPDARDARGDGARRRVGDDVYGEDETVNALERAGRGAVRTRGGALRPLGDDGQPDRRRALGGARRRGLRAPRLAPPDRRGRRRRGALGRADARAPQRRATRSTSTSCATRCRWTRATSTGRGRASSASRTRMRSRGGRVWSAEALARVDRGARTRSACACTWTARACRTPPSRAAARWPRRARGPTACQFCFSKGLGAPVGSILVSSAEAIARGARAAQAARRRHAPGRRASPRRGSTRSTTTSARLADDHARARALAVALADCPRVSVDLASVETNIVLARVCARRAGAGASSTS